MQAECYSLPKCKRLLKPADYQEVFAQQKKVFYQGLVIYYRNNTLSYPRLGLVVSKRVLKKAVARNLLKRMTRESFRLKQQDLNSKDLVIVATKHLTEGSLWRVPAILAQLWKRLAESSSSI